MGRQKRELDENSDQPGADHQAFQHAEHEYLPRPVLVQPDGARGSHGSIAQYRVDRRRPRHRAHARRRGRGGSGGIETWWLYSQEPTLRYAHADPHAAAYKLTGTPTIILGNDGGFHVSEDDGATFSSDKNNGLVTHLYYTVAGNPSLPNVVVGGTQDNGTRVRRD